MSLTVFILLRSQSHMCFFSTRSLVPISSFTNVLFVRFSYKLLFPFTLHLARFLSNFLSHSHDSLFLTISFSFSFSLFRSCLMLTFFSNTFFLSICLYLSLSLSLSFFRSFLFLLYHLFALKRRPSSSLFFFPCSVHFFVWSLRQSQMQNYISDVGRIRKNQKQQNVWNV